MQLLVSCRSLVELLHVRVQTSQLPSGARLPATTEFHSRTILQSFAWSALASFRSFSQATWRSPTAHPSHLRGKKFPRKLSAASELKLLRLLRPPLRPPQALRAALKTTRDLCTEAPPRSCALGLWHAPLSQKPSTKPPCKT